MKKYDKKIVLCGEERTVEITFKNVKRLNIRLRDYGIFVSAPFFVSEKQVDEFIESNRRWLEKRIIKHGERIAAEAEKRDIVTYLGKEYKLTFVEGNGIEFEDGLCKVGISKGMEQAKIDFEEFWKKEAYRFFVAETKRALEVCAKRFGIGFFPKISIAKVKSYWGKCYMNRREIKYNYYLLQADYGYCRYVVYHELAHFLYRDHGKAFYAAIKEVLPDSEFQKSRGKLWRTVMWTDCKTA